MVDRLPGDGDRRTVRLVTTDVGRMTLRRAETFRQARLTSVLAGWTDADVADLADRLSRLAAAVRER